MLFMEVMRKGVASYSPSLERVRGRFGMMTIVWSFFYNYAGKILSI